MSPSKINGNSYTIIEGGNKGTVPMQDYLKRFMISRTKVAQNGHKIPVNNATRTVADSFQSSGKTYSERVWNKYAIDKARAQFYK